MTIIKQIAELYVRKRATKDIDHNPGAALMLAFIIVALTTVDISARGIFKPALVTSIGAVLIELGIFYAILSIHNKTPRFLQMITATMGVAIISSILVLLTLQLEWLTALQVPIKIWGLYLSITILKEVLECSFFKALAFTIAVTFVALMLLISMFGDMEMIEQLQQQQAPQQSSSSAMTS